ncbi:MAG: helix-turn-helix transcriptional regulator [Planctomycetota bacterium]|nr:helix-turn-helix transcriptional regulator [Planctomycetota bacterium]
MTFFPSLGETHLPTSQLQQLFDATNVRVSALQEIGLQREAERLLQNMFLETWTCQTHKKLPEARQAFFSRNKPHRLCLRTETENSVRLAHYLQRGLDKDGSDWQLAQISLSQGRVRNTSDAIRDASRELRGQFVELMTSNPWREMIRDFYWSFQPLNNAVGLTINLQIWVRHRAMVSKKDPDLASVLRREVQLHDLAALKCYSDSEDLWQDFQNSPRWGSGWGGFFDAKTFANWSHAFTGRKRFHLEGGEVRGDMLRSARTEPELMPTCPKCSKRMLLVNKMVSVESFLEESSDEYQVNFLVSESTAPKAKPKSAKVSAPIPEELTDSAKRQLCQAFGARLESARAACGYTRAHVAQVVGASIAAYQSWERGLNYPRVDSLIRLCRMLNVTSDFLLFGMKGDQKAVGLIDQLQDKIRRLRGILNE